MELPSWLKIENIIGKLNLSGRFKYESRKQVINIQKVEVHNHITILPANVEGRPKIVKEDEIFEERIKTEEQKEFEFSDNEKYLITKINKVHELCGCRGFDFSKNYRQALNHIKNKPSDDWYECAAKDMVLIKENISFFSAFQEIKDPSKIELFKNYKQNISNLYDSIQKIKHSNKRGSIEEKYLSPDDKLNNLKLTDKEYEEIFGDFQKYLIELFKKFKIKKKI